jgi:ParB family chromosome partitioning protein
MKIEIRKIKTGNDRRQTSEVKVRELAESIKQNGLINPITIGRDNFLIAGLHRLEACKLLGWKEIECKKEDCIHNEDKFKLLEIDENLIRSELDYITRGDLQVEKDEILERLGLRADQSNKGELNSPVFTGAPSAPVKTTANLAKEIGVSERTLQEEKQISRSLSAEVKKIAREIELPKKDAIELSKKTHEEQKKIINKIKSGEIKKAHVSFNSGENEWYTPKYIIDAVVKVMGKIDVDPASSEIANKTINAKIFYTIETNGLKQKWTGNVWLNPPYSQPLIFEFSEAVCKKFEKEEFEEICILVNNATETKWFQNMLKICSSVCFLNGRVKFIDVKGNPNSAPLQGQAIIYMGSNTVGFKKIFNELGVVLSNE